MKTLQWCFPAHQSFLHIAKPWICIQGLLQKQSQVLSWSYLRMSLIVFQRGLSPPQPIKGQLRADSTGRQFELRGMHPTPSAEASSHLGEDLSTVQLQPLGRLFSVSSFDV